MISEEIHDLLTKNKIRVKRNYSTNCYELYYKNRKVTFTTMLVESLYPHEAYDSEEEIIDDELPNGDLLTHKVIIHHEKMTKEDIINIYKEIIKKLIR